MSGGDAGNGSTITSLASARDVAWAFARCLPALRAQMRLLRWASIGLIVFLLLVFPPTSIFGIAFRLVGAVVILGVTSTYGLARYYETVVRRTPTLTIPQTVTLGSGGLRFLDHESDRRYVWQRWESVDDVPEGIALVLRGGWQADLLHAGAFTSPSHRAEWFAAIRSGVADVNQRPG